MPNFNSELVSPLAQEVLQSQSVTIRPHDSLGEYPGLQFAGNDFYVDIETGYTPDDCDPEPDTLLIDYVSSQQEGKGIATAALSNILVQAKTLEYRYARMLIIAPKMVHIAQRLVDLRYASSIGFATCLNDDPISKSTQRVAESKDLSADQAYGWLNDVTANMAKITARTGETQDMPGHISCAFDLREI